MMDTIKRFRGKYFFLSNFYEAPVTYKGITFPSSEAAFWAQREENPENRYAYCAMKSDKAKRIGCRASPRKDWEEVKEGIMREIVLAKFVQNPDLGAKLVATGDVCLGKDRDPLSKILMDVRLLLAKRL